MVTTPTQGWTGTGLNPNLQFNPVLSGISNTLSNIGKQPAPLFGPAGSGPNQLNVGPDYGMHIPAPAKPTSVVGSNTVQKKVIPKIQGAIDNQTNLQNNRKPSGTNDVRDENGLLVNPPGALYDRNTGKLLNPPSDTTPPPSPTAEDSIMHDGQVQLYNQRTGAQEWVDPNTPGYGPQNPLTKVASGVQDVGEGIQYKQYADGTYARFNANTGEYSQATAGDYQDATQQKTVKDKINSIINGTYQLSPAEQSQITGIQAKYNDLIAKTQTENANITGGMTIAQNMYGMGNAPSGQGMIHQTVLDGLDRVKTLQDELAGKVADMTMAFEKDDMDMLKTSYDAYESGQGEISKEIDTLDAKIQAAKDAQATKEENYAYQQMTRYGDADITPGDSYAQIEAKKQNSAIYQNELKTKAGTIDQNVLDGMLKIYNKTGVIPAGMGNASMVLKEAFYKAIGGSPGIVDEATANKAALTGATKSLSTQQNQYAANQTSIGTLDKQIGLVQKYSDAVSRTDSPLVNKYALWLKGKGAGDADTAALNNIVKTASYEFAKILSGAAASIQGVTVSSAADAEDMLNSAMSKGQFETVLDLMKQESNFRLTTQKSTIDQIQQDIRDLGNMSTSSSNSNDTGGFATTW